MNKLAISNNSRQKYKSINDQNREFLSISKLQNTNRALLSLVYHAFNLQLHLSCLVLFHLLNLRSQPTFCTLALPITLAVLVTGHYMIGKTHPSLLGCGPVQ